MVIYRQEIGDLDHVAPMRPLKVFVSFAPADEGLAKEFEEHLSLLKRQRIIENWHSRKVAAGDVWKDQILARLEEADLIVFLVSSAFIASDQNYAVEMAYALDQHQGRRVQVLPILIRSCDWMAAPFAKFQLLPYDGAPVAAAHDRDPVWAEVVGAIRQAAAQKLEQQVTHQPARPLSGSCCEEALRLLRTRLPRVLTAAGADPRATLLRASIPAPVGKASNLLDEWTLVCDWIARAGRPGFVHAFRLVDEVQQSHFSDDVSGWAADFIETLLQEFGGGGDGREELGEDAKRELRRYVERETERWEELRRKVQNMNLSKESIDYVADMADIWKQASRRLGWARSDWTEQPPHVELLNIASDVSHAQTG